MTRNGSRPFGWTWWIASTLGCTTAAAAWASRANRFFARELWARCGASTLIATQRFSSRSNPLRTTPMPPRPTISSMSYAPNRPRPSDRRDGSGCSTEKSTSDHSSRAGTASSSSSPTSKAAACRPPSPVPAGGIFQTHAESLARFKMGAERCSSWGDNVPASADSRSSWEHCSFMFVFPEHRPSAPQRALVPKLRLGTHLREAPRDDFVLKQGDSTGSKAAGDAVPSGGAWETRARSPTLPLPASRPRLSVGPRRGILRCARRRSLCRVLRVSNWEAPTTLVSQKACQVVVCTSAHDFAGR